MPALKQGMEASVLASTRTSNLGSATWLFVTECAVAHCPQRDVVSLLPQGLTSGGEGRKKLLDEAEVHNDVAGPF